MNQENANRSLLKRQLLAPLIILACIVLASSEALACSCAAYPEDAAKAAAKAYQQADAIFLGAVIAVKAKRLRLPPVRETTFDVLDAWKGLSGDNVALVRSVIGETACGYKFRKSGKYLVVAHWDAKREVLTTNMCELNRKESEAQGLISELDKLSRLK